MMSDEEFIKPTARPYYDMLAYPNKDTVHVVTPDKVTIYYSDGRSEEIILRGNTENPHGHGMRGK